MNASSEFEPAMSIPVQIYADAKARASGLSSKEASKLLDFIGPNKIPFEPDTIVDSVAMEFFGWFYLFQLMAYMIWCGSSCRFSALLQIAEFDFL